MANETSESVVPRKGRFALSAPLGGYDWWEINDLEAMVAVVSVEATLPNAKEIVDFAWSRIDG